MLEVGAQLPSYMRLADCEAIRNYIPLLSEHRHMHRSQNTEK